MTGFGREIKDYEDPRKQYKPNIKPNIKPWEIGSAGFNKYGDFLGFGKQAEEEHPLAGYKSPFTTLKKEGWNYNNGGLSKPYKMPESNDPLGKLPDFTKQQKPASPFTSIVEQYNSRKYR